MTTAEATALRASLTTLLSVYLPTSKISQYIRQWRDDVNGCVAPSPGGPTSEVAGQDPAGLVASTVSALGTAAAAGNGAEAIVTDATVATNGTTVVGGGSTRVLVRSNGTLWQIV